MLCFYVKNAVYVWLGHQGDSPLALLKYNRQVKTALVASMNARPASNNNRQRCLNAARCDCYQEQAIEDAACLLTLTTSRVQTTYKLITFVHVGSMVANYLFLT